MSDSTGCFWIRVFDYVYERDTNYENESFGKGVLLDEFYLKDVTGGREEAKQIVKEKYVGSTAAEIAFAKPKKKDGVYAIVMDSNKFFYDRFYVTIDTYCLHCHRPIKGKASEFPKLYVSDEEVYYFCSYDCKRECMHQLNPISEGVFQEKEEGCHGDIFGYIYLIYNRVEDVYYVGQTRYMPFFRWQEHVKNGGKGDIKDLAFSVLTEVGRNQSLSTETNQLYLNSIEAWWIAKYQEEGNKVFNISNPKITIEYLKNRFDEMVRSAGQLKMAL
jgi:YHS domain-containing protein